MVHRRQKYPDFTPKETSQAPQAQTLTPYVDADGPPPDSLLTFRFRYARRNCQSGSDRLENQPTDPAAAGRDASYL
jgi:hypothetical protein